MLRVWFVCFAVWAVSLCVFGVVTGLGCSSLSYLDIGLEVSTCTLLVFGTEITVAVTLASNERTKKILVLIALLALIMNSE